MAKFFQIKKSIRFGHHHQHHSKQPRLSTSCVFIFIALTSLFSSTHSIYALGDLLSSSPLSSSPGGFHPSKMLSHRDSPSPLSSSSSGSSQQLSAASSAQVETLSRDPLREDEVMYHLYRNGHSNGDYHKASTTFMVNLFNQLQNGQPLTSQFRSHAVTDTIRSFSGNNLSRTRKGRQVVRFYVPYLPWHERLRSAEIRFLRKPNAKTKPRRFKIRVDVRKNRKLIKKFVLHERSEPQHGYDVFDVSRILRPWINGFHGNVSLQVKVSKKLESHTQVALEDTSLQSTSLIVLYLEDRQFLKNMYKSYTSDTAKEKDYVQATPKPQSPKNANRIRRSLPFSDPVFADILSNSLDSSQESQNKLMASSKKRSKRDNTTNQRKRRIRKNRKWYRGGKRSKCQLYDFDVDFGAIGWGQWIIHPKRFNARFCFGVCPSPIDSKFQPTNHAMLQTLMKMKRPNAAPSPCCVPTTLNAVSMLYFEYDEIVVRHHEDMVAAECGCR